MTRLKERPATVDNNDPMAKAVLGATWLRILLAPAMAATIISGQFNVTVVLVVAFVGWDVIDGIAARESGSESFQRRMADAIVDRVGIHFCFLSLTIVEGALSTVWIALILRDVCQTAFSKRLLSFGIIPSGDVYHKMLGVAVAVFGILSLAGWSSHLLSTGLTSAAIVLCVTFCAQVSKLPLAEAEEIGGVIRVRTFGRSQMPPCD